MAAWSQSPFLQALGWAMLNSFWQMALLFGLFSLFRHFAPLSSHQKYYGAIVSMALGLFWFAYTFVSFYDTGAAANLFYQHQLAPTSQTWNLLLSSASVTYLVLLLIPAWRLFQNWRYIEHLKKSGLQKTAMEYRLFVKKVAQRLGIRHTVHVYLSSLVQSPLTIGYLKPVILLPIAAINSLSTQQVEAILLHELSHIKRYDYLINLLITFLQTLFYFNPFVKRFVSIIELERESCSDELVLQFQYDKVSYASALLQLEKNILASEALILAAAGKKHLLHRVEKIIGLEKRSRFTFNQFAGLLTSFIVVLFIHSLFFVNKEVKPTQSQTFTVFENPLYQYETPLVGATNTKGTAPVKKAATEKIATVSGKVIKKENGITDIPQTLITDPHIMPVAYDASDEMVTAAEKAQISQTLETTKKVLTKTKWKEVEVSIGDGMTRFEKVQARNEYLKEVNKIDWQKLENHLKSEYEHVNWEEIDAKLNTALTDIKLDSLQNAYHTILIQLKKLEQTNPNCAAVLPVPDVSVQKANQIIQKLSVKLDSIQVIREQKVINF